MCGIIGIVSNIDCIQDLIAGIKQLQNRGYDSAGICVLNGAIFYLTKYATTSTDDSIKLIENYISENPIQSKIGIFHTRWSTNGPKTDVNSHPHLSMNGTFSIIHNGVIENYRKLRKDLIEKGYEFISETDTEVVVNLMEYIYQETNNTLRAIKKTLSMLEGTWGFVIMSINEPNKLYCTRHGSPLLVGFSDNCVMVTSEKSGFCNKVDNYFSLSNQDICIITDNSTEQITDISYSTIETYEVKELTDVVQELTPDPYETWTLKEIYEQPVSAMRAISYGGRLYDDHVKLGGLEENIDKIMSLENIIILGCGTSYNAGLIGRYYLNDLCDFNTVQVFDGAEFTQEDIPKNGRTGVIMLSQSGETMDLCNCFETIRENDLFTIGVVNVVDSLIANEVNCGCYLNAGREVAVGSTKTFTSQLIVLSMIAIWIAQNKNINYEKRIQYVNDLRKLHMDIRQTLESIDETLDPYIKNLNKDNMFILGKSKSEAIAHEGALKIKELSYIHAESYSASKLKHGPFAMLEPDFPVILIAPHNKYYNNVMNAYEEIRSREAYVLMITDNENTIAENKIIVVRNKMYQEILITIVLQLFAYKLTFARNLKPDRPRNLAKTVTVL
jgi:glutamine---fructose-6-phosphate transaminase (isomerizing)